MAGITLAQAQAQLDAWLAASTAVAGGQRYTIGSRTLERADVQFITQQIDYWERKVQQLTNNPNGAGIRLRGITPG